VALYARVSTDEQDITGQVRRLEQYAELMRYEVANVWKDEGVSGADGSRPQLDAMLEAKGYDAIIVTKLDRIMRSLINLENLIKQLDRRKVSLISIDEGIDTGAEGDDHAKRLVRQILGAVAEWERNMIRSRVSEGMTKAKRYGTKSGNPIGRPRLPDERLSKDAVRMRRLRERERTKPPLPRLNTPGHRTEVEQSFTFVRKG
jgi:DNA invertase Pin-like site-specific DNA recombinase